ncbi:MAG TPA: O-antigen ligase family protein [Actinoplanes sp.]|nr:O-antigen ligase family protein [Actinoplanes sp.]
MTSSPATLDARYRTEVVRLVVFCGALVAAVISAGGLVQSLLFAAPSPLKYAVTVAVSAYSLIVLATPKPMLVLAVTTTFVAPFAATASFAGVSVTPGLLALFVSVAVLVTTRPGAGPDVWTRRSLLAVAGPAAVASLAVPLLRGHRTVEVAVVVLAMFGMGWLVARVARDDLGRRWVVTGLCAGAALQAGLGGYEFLTGRPLNLYGNSAGYAASYIFSYTSGQSSVIFRPSAALPDPISLGNLLAVALPLMLALTVSAASRRLRSAATVATLVTAVGLVLTLSRMSWFGAVGGLLVAVALMPARRLVAAVATLALTALPVVVFAFSGLAGDALHSRVVSAFDPTGTSSDSRAEDLTRVAIWHASVRLAAQHPVGGVGVGNLPSYLMARVAPSSVTSHAHSTYLNVLAEAGAIGFLALLYLLFSALRDAGRGLRTDRCLYAGVLGALVAMLIVWSTDYTVRGSAMAMVFGALIGLAAAGSRLVTRR